MKFLSLAIISALFFSCSSGKKPREFKLEYEVVNASNKIEPDWIEDVDTYKGQKNYRYFVAESDNATKRLCLKSSEARATAVIAGEVLQDIQSDYAEVTRQNEDKEVEQFFSESLRQLIQTQVSGIRVVKQYWEKRKFKADEDGESKVTYACYTLVGITDKRLDKAIKYAQNQALGKVEPSLKEELEKKFSEKK